MKYYFYVLREIAVVYLWQLVPFFTVYGIKITCKYNKQIVIFCIIWYSIMNICCDCISPIVQRSSNDVCGDINDGYN